MRIVVEKKRPVRGDARFSCPGVPPKRTVPPEGDTYPPVPEELYPVMLYAEGRSLRIGMVGSYQVGIETRWAWYCLIRGERNFMRDTPTAGSAAKRILRQLTEKLGDEEIGGHLSMQQRA